MARPVMDEDIVVAEAEHDIEEIAWCIAALKAREAGEQR